MQRSPVAAARGMRWEPFCGARGIICVIGACAWWGDPTIDGETRRDAMLTEKLLNLTLAGGSEWVMILLIALSVISIAVIIERALAYMSAGKAASKLDNIVTELPVGSLKGLNASKTDTLRNNPVIAAALNASTSDDTDKLVSAALERYRMGLEKRLSFLGTLGSNAPFVGLLGTVLGIIKAFRDLSLESKGGASTVMAGISEALVATAIGLFVAIPAVVAYNYFGRKLDGILGRVEASAATVMGRHISASDIVSVPDIANASKDAGKGA